MDIATVFEWFAEESKSIAEQETEPAQREKFVKLASLWANATAESTSETSLPRPDLAESTGALVDSGYPPSGRALNTPGDAPAASELSGSRSHRHAEPHAC